MKNGQKGDRLSWGDTVFLHLEREGMPLNVACLCIFDGKISFDDCVQFVESKLPLIPRYLKRVIPSLLNIGLPSWEYDPAFDIRNHVREVTLKQGSDSELKALAGKTFSTVMNREHPLWDMTLVHGVKGDRTGLIFRLHHCLADGIAGVGIMNVLMDASPVAPRLPKRKLRLQIPPPRPALDALAQGCVDSYSEFVKQLFDAVANVSGMAERFAVSGGGLSTADSASSFFPELFSPTERLRFNVMYRGPQKFAGVAIPLEAIKNIKRACGASVNDVVLSLVTATIQRYLELHGDSTQGRLLRIMVPVNLRGSTGANELGNRISLVPVTLPLDIRQPRKLLAAVHERTEFLKRAHTAELVSLAGGLIGVLPLSAQAVAGQVLNRLSFTPFNMVCTNVPGPQLPLYLLGHKMSECYPYVPVGGEMTLNCAILTYNGTAYFGFSGDQYAVPDLRRLESLLKRNFEQLCQSIDHKKTEKKTRQRNNRLRKSRIRNEAASLSSPAQNSSPDQTFQKETQTSSELGVPKVPVTKEELAAQMIA